jgi:hypothetical protein
VSSSLTLILIFVVSQELRIEKDEVEQRIRQIGEEIASDLGLQMDKSIRLEWYKVSNTRTRCLRITQVTPLLGAVHDLPTDPVTALLVCVRAHHA